jgi:phytoene desaturase
MGDFMAQTDPYDVVVVGSGMGGLSAAALIANRGYKTLLVEKYGRLGGRFSTFEYKGYKLPTGAIGVEQEGVVEQVFKTVGADFNVTPLPGLHYYIHGKHHEIPEKGGVRALLDVLSQTKTNRAKIVGRIGKEIAATKIADVMGALKRGVTEKEKTALSFREWLSRYTDDEDVMAVFRSIIYALYSVNDAEMPASIFFRFINSKVGRGYRKYGYATNGNIDLVNALARSIEEKNGEVWTNAEVKSIVVNGKKAKSVLIMRNGTETEIPCSAVVSNAGPKQTMALVGEKNLNSRYVKQTKDLLACPVFSFMIGSDRPLVDVPAVNYMGCRNLGHIALVSNICPGLAPKGRHLAVTFGYPASSLKVMNSRIEVENHFKDLNDVFPEFEKFSEILHIGIHNAADEWPAYHSFPGEEMPQQTPVENVYNVGDGVRPSGWTGLPSCAQTGVLVAEEIGKMLSLKS